MLNLIRISVCIPFLFYACYSDLKIRKAPNKIWHLFILIGIMLALLDILKQGPNFLVRFSLSVIVLAVFAYMLFRIKVLGGADAKAIIALSIAVPTFPLVPLKGIPFLNLFAFSVFGNAILLMFIIPFLIFFYNLTQLSTDELRECFFYSFLGYKSKISEMRNSRIKLIESYTEQDGNIIRKFVPRGVDIDAKTMRRLQRLAKDRTIPSKIWVTPDLPFMIPLTLGFIVALVYGDLVYLVIFPLVSMICSLG